MDDVTYMRVKFYVDGSKRKGTVHVDLKKVSGYEFHLCSQGWARPDQTSTNFTLSNYMHAFATLHRYTDRLSCSQVKEP